MISCASTALFVCNVILFFHYEKDTQIVGNVAYYTDTNESVWSCGFTSSYKWFKPVIQSEGLGVYIVSGWL